ncbi:MAG: hypothetical protein HN336_03875 [Lentimicrobiaceae bacterium]|jgi:hypothetical protein|nr:hypothetical protein [Lentimicrobiaceae bacterium]MCP4909736.1 hypothetical protein [Bacteroidota bacterium]MBT3455248.1 hypothetical protein [Lentimicrobiaceae bacterium]MBT3817886.1 hypothetical protein [Lentimicrobiaceae bacterium]MBT4060667.1 hypothetical protein [Lentimicrobiaceae bacterium]
MNQREFSQDIPKRFYSDITDQPFENCNICNINLLDNEEPYVVEKAMRNYEGHTFSSTIYEFAICQKCHTKMQQTMSPESLQSLHNYHNEVMSSKGSQPIMIDMNSFNLDNWLSTCFFYGEEIKNMNEYQLVAQFKGNKMILNTPPIIIGENAMKKMAGLLSEKTTDEMNGFREKYLGPSPEIEELIYGKKLILL